MLDEGYNHPESMSQYEWSVLAKDGLVHANAPEVVGSQLRLGEKPTNPKDACGVLKSPLSYVSLPVLFEVGLGMLEGGYKYGRHNYRTIGVRASIYFDATMRHLSSWWEGEDFDPDSRAKIHHLSKAIASLTVMRDAIINDMWEDDRPPRPPAGWMEAFNAEVKKLNEQYPNPKPPHTEKGRP